MTLIPIVIVVSTGISFPAKINWFGNIIMDIYVAKLNGLYIKVGLIIVSAVGVKSDNGTFVDVTPIWNIPCPLD